MSANILEHNPIEYYKPGPLKSSDVFCGISDLLGVSADFVSSVPGVSTSPQI